MPATWRNSGGGYGFRDILIFEDYSDRSNVRRSFIPQPQRFRIHMITDIIFDLGNVLVPLNWDNAFGNLTAGMEKPADLDRHFINEALREPTLALETGKIDFMEFQYLISKALNLRMEAERFRQLWCSIFSIDKDMVLLGKNLSRTYGTWLASNTGKVHYEYILETFPEVVFFQDAALSFEFGVMKPSRAFFEKAVTKFKIDPSRSVFVDDIPENVEGAEQFGIRGIVFQNVSRLVLEFRELGIKVPGKEGSD